MGDQQQKKNVLHNIVFLPPPFLFFLEMDLLSSLSMNDLRWLQEAFGDGDGLAKEAFVDTLLTALRGRAPTQQSSSSSAPPPRTPPSPPLPSTPSAGASRWGRQALTTLFYEIDYDNNGSVSWSEFTSFVIACGDPTSTPDGYGAGSGAGRSPNMRAAGGGSSGAGGGGADGAADGDATAAGAVVSAERIGLKLRGDPPLFTEQCTQLSRLFFIPDAAKLIAASATRVTIHDATTPHNALVGRAKVSGELLAAAYHAGTASLVCSTTRGVVEIFDATKGLSLHRTFNALCPIGAMAPLAGGANVLFCGDTSGQIMAVDATKFGPLAAIDVSPALSDVRGPRGGVNVAPTTTPQSQQGPSAASPHGSGGGNGSGMGVGASTFASTARARIGPAPPSGAANGGRSGFRAGVADSLIAKELLSGLSPQQRREAEALFTNNNPSLASAAATASSTASSSTALMGVRSCPIRAVTKYTLGHHRADISSLEYVSAGRRPLLQTLLTASMDNTMALVDTETTALIGALPSAHTSYVRGTAVNAARGIVVTYGDDAFAGLTPLALYSNATSATSASAFAASSSPLSALGRHNRPQRLDDGAVPHAARLVGAVCCDGTDDVITADISGMIKVWDLRMGGRCVQTCIIPQVLDPTYSRYGAGGPTLAGLVRGGGGGGGGGAIVGSLLSTSSPSATEKKNNKKNSPRRERQPQQSSSSPSPPLAGSHHLSGTTTRRIIPRRLMPAGISYNPLTQQLFALGPAVSVFDKQRQVKSATSHSEPIVAIAYNPHTFSIVTCTATDMALWSVRTGICSARHPNIVAAFAAAAATNSSSGNGDGDVEGEVSGRGGGGYHHRPQAVTVGTITCLSIDALQGGRRALVGTSGGYAVSVVPVSGAVAWAYRCVDGRAVPPSLRRVAFCEAAEDHNIIVGLGAGCVKAFREAFLSEPSRLLYVPPALEPVFGVVGEDGDGDGSSQSGERHRFFAAQSPPSPSSTSLQQQRQQQNGQPAIATAAHRMAAAAAEEAAVKAKGEAKERLAAAMALLEPDLISASAYSATAALLVCAVRLDATLVIVSTATRSCHARPADPRRYTGKDGRSALPDTRNGDRRSACGGGGGRNADSEKDSSALLVLPPSADVTEILSIAFITEHHPWGVGSASSPSSHSPTASPTFSFSSSSGPSSPHSPPPSPLGALTLFATGDQLGAVNVYSARAGDPHCPLTTAWLITLHTRGHAPCWALGCAQSRFLSAGTDGGAVASWDVGPLVAATALFGVTLPDEEEAAGGEGSGSSAFAERKRMSPKTTGASKLVKINSPPTASHRREKQSPAEGALPSSAAAFAHANSSSDVPVPRSSGDDVADFSFRVASEDSSSAPSTRPAAAGGNASFSREDGLVNSDADREEALSSPTKASSSSRRERERLERAMARVRSAISLGGGLLGDLFAPISDALVHNINSAATAPPEAAPPAQPPTAAVSPSSLLAVGSSSTCGVPPPSASSDPPPLTASFAPIVRPGDEAASPMAEGIGRKGVLAASANTNANADIIAPPSHTVPSLVDLLRSLRGIEQQHQKGGSKQPFTAFSEGKPKQLSPMAREASSLSSPSKILVGKPIRIVRGEFRVPGLSGGDSADGADDDGEGQGGGNAPLPHPSSKDAAAAAAEGPLAYTAAPITFCVPLGAGGALAVATGCLAPSVVLVLPDGRRIGPLCSSRQEDIHAGMPPPREESEGAEHTAGAVLGDMLLGVGAARGDSTAASFEGLQQQQSKAEVTPTAVTERVTALTAATRRVAGDKDAAIPPFDYVGIAAASQRLVRARLTGPSAALRVLFGAGGAASLGGTFGFGVGGRAPSSPRGGGAKRPPPPPLSPLVLLRGGGADGPSALTSLFPSLAFLAESEMAALALSYPPPHLRSPRAGSVFSTESNGPATVLSRTQSAAALSTRSDGSTGTAAADETGAPPKRLDAGAPRRSRHRSIRGTTASGGTSALSSPSPSFRIGQPSSPQSPTSPTSPQHTVPSSSAAVTFAAAPAPCPPPSLLTAPNAAAAAPAGDEVANRIVDIDLSRLQVNKARNRSLRREAQRREEKAAALLKGADAALKLAASAARRGSMRFLKTDTTATAGAGGGGGYEGAGRALTNGSVDVGDAEAIADFVFAGMERRRRKSVAKAVADATNFTPAPPPVVMAEEGGGGGGKGAGRSRRRSRRGRGDEAAVGTDGGAKEGSKGKDDSADPAIPPLLEGLLAREAGEKERRAAAEAQQQRRRKRNAARKIRQQSRARRRQQSIAAFVNSTRKNPFMFDPQEGSASVTLLRNPPNGGRARQLSFLDASALFASASGWDGGGGGGGGRRASVMSASASGVFDVFSGGYDSSSSGEGGRGSDSSLEERAGDAAALARRRTRRATVSLVADAPPPATSTAARFAGRRVTARFGPSLALFAPSPLRTSLSTSGGAAPPPAPAETAGGDSAASPEAAAVSGGAEHRPRRSIEGANAAERRAAAAALLLAGSANVPASNLAQLRTMATAASASSAASPSSALGALLAAHDASAAQYEAALGDTADDAFSDGEDGTEYVARGRRGRRPIRPKGQARLAAVVGPTNAVVASAVVASLPSVAGVSSPNSAAPLPIPLGASLSLSLSASPARREGGGASPQPPPQRLPSLPTTPRAAASIGSGGRASSVSPANSVPPAPPAFIPKSPQARALASLPAEMRDVIRRIHSKSTDAAPRVQVIGGGGSSPSPSSPSHANSMSSAPPSPAAAPLLSLDSPPLSTAATGVCAFGGTSAATTVAPTATQHMHSNPIAYGVGGTSPSAAPLSSVYLRPTPSVYVPVAAVPAPPSPRRAAAASVEAAASPPVPAPPSTGSTSTAGGYTWQRPSPRNTALELALSPSPPAQRLALDPLPQKGVGVGVGAGALASQAAATATGGGGGLLPSAPHGSDVFRRLTGGGGGPATPRRLRALEAAPSPSAAGSAGATGEISVRNRR